MKFIKPLVLISPLLLLIGCRETRVLSGNKLYQYVSKQGVIGQNDYVVEYEVKSSFNSKIKDKTDHFLIEDVDVNNLDSVGTAYIDGSKRGNFAELEGKFYTSETNKFIGNKQFDKQAFRYQHAKFVLSSMTIPLKYRSGVGNDTINPPTLETGFNVNFAPSIRWIRTSFDPTKKFLGSTSVNYSLSVGGLFGIGGTDLNINTNAVGLLSNRKSTILTYGGIVLFGLNSIGIGYAFGFDNVLGKGKEYWVYQNRLWHGVTVSVDIIK